MKSVVKNALTTPRKMHLILKAVKKIKKVSVLLSTLRFINKKAAGILSKAVQSAVANAQHFNKQPNNINKIDIEKLEIEYINIGRGEVRKRLMPRARGHSDQIHKYTTNIRVELKSQQYALDVGVSTKEEIKEPAQNV